VGVRLGVAAALGLEVLLGAGIAVLVARGVFVLAAGVLVLATLAERVTPRVRFSATVVATAGVLTTTACV
jgi:hypothetical protein